MRPKDLSGNGNHVSHLVDDLIPGKTKTKLQLFQVGQTIELSKSLIAVSEEIL